MVCVWLLCWGLGLAMVCSSVVFVACWFCWWLVCVLVLCGCCVCLARFLAECFAVALI